MSMNSIMIWLVIVLVGIGTFLLRFSGIQVFGERRMPPWLSRALRYVPAAVVAAIVVPAMVHGGPDPGFTLENNRLLAGMVAAVVAWRTRGILTTLAAGMVSLWLLEWLLG